MTTALFSGTYNSLTFDFFITYLLTFANFLIDSIVVWETFTIFAA